MDSCFVGTQRELYLDQHLIKDPSAATIFTLFIAATFPIFVTKFTIFSLINNSICKQNHNTSLPRFTHFGIDGFFLLAKHFVLTQLHNKQYRKFLFLWINCKCRSFYHYS